MDTDWLDHTKGVVVPEISISTIIQRDECRLTESQKPTACWGFFRLGFYFLYKTLRYVLPFDK